MSLIAKLSVVAVLGVACAACSSQNGTPASSAPVASASSAEQAPPPSAIPMTAPAAGASSAALPPAPAGDGPSFSDMMKRPGFAHAFAQMDGASALPDWVKGGGTATPATRVTVNGEGMWLNHACKDADCKGDQLWLLVDPASHKMQGLFVENSGSTGASVQKLDWLGKPDAETQAYLKDRVTKK